jgi:DNA-binding NarL/FixJ family response regulator
MSDQQRHSATTILVVDDHQLLTDALTGILHSHADWQVLGVAASCAAARAALGRGCPAVVLLDVELPDGDGLSLVGDIQRACPQAYILVLTSFSDEATLLRAIEAGVNGFISKERPLSEVLTAIAQALSGEIVMPTSLLLGLLGRMRQPRGAPAAPASPELLTPRQQEILVCLAQGLSGAQIAAALNISVLTVRTHITNVLEKLGVHSRLEAVSYALRHGLIDPDFERQKRQ